MTCCELSNGEFSLSRYNLLSFIKTERGFDGIAKRASARLIDQDDTLDFVELKKIPNPQKGLV